VVAQELGAAKKEEMHNQPFTDAFRGTI